MFEAPYRVKQQGGQTMEWVFYIEFELYMLYSVEYLLHYDLLFPVCNHMSFEVEGDLMFNFL